VFILTHAADLEGGFALQGDEVVGYTAKEDEFALSGTRAGIGEYL